MEPLVTWHFEAIQFDNPTPIRLMARGSFRAPTNDPVTAARLLMEARPDLKVILIERVQYEMIER